MQDFETEGTPDPSKKESQPKPTQPKVEPQKPLRVPQGTQTIGQAKNGGKAPIKPVNQAKRKKAILGCLGAVGAVILAFIILAFVFIAQSDKAATSPIAKLLNLNQATFVNGLITLIHITFVLLALTAFVFTMIGIFKAAMAKKEDKVTKKKGLKTSFISGSILFLLLIVWVFAYVYLDSKRILLSPEVTNEIVTEPENTLGLEAPVKVRFDASRIQIDKLYQAISYDWDFDDGEQQTSQIVTHTFAQKGRYDVTLKITRREKKTGEEVTDVYTTTVNVDRQKLSAIFSADPLTGEAPLEVTFDATDSIDPDDRIERYEWDFNEDGLFDDAEGEEVKHTFKKNGKYVVSLRVTNSSDESAIAEKEIFIKAVEEPKPLISIANDPDELTIDQSYVFQSEGSTSPNGDIEDYEWDMGDGTTKNTKTVSHIYKTPGTYEVKLKVTDEDGKTGEVEKIITVEAAKGTPKAKIKTTPELKKGDLSLNGESPFEITFDATSSTDPDNNIVDYKWDFESDGKYDAFGKTVTQIFSKEGTYTVTLTVVDADNLSSDATIGVKVQNQGITAVLKADPIQGTVPLTVDFDATGSSFQGGTITSFQWDFGDGTAPKLGDAQISHKYSAIGTYTASVTAIGNDNSKSTQELLITVREIPLTACFTSVFTEGDAPLSTTFDPACSTGTVNSYFWDFGDGTTSSEVKPTHTFNSAGTYVVELEITDSQNTISKKELTIKVK